MYRIMREIVKESAVYLASAGLAASRLEAELLVARAANLDRTQLYVQFDRPMTETELAMLRPMLKARAKDRVPIAYLTGHKSFFGLDLLAEKGVFIPRPETEELVEAAAARLAKMSVDRDALEILDLCTGTGAVALSLARVFPRSQILATDISPEAISIAASNAERLGLANRVTVRQGDLWQAIAPGRRFHAVAANPPYIPRGALPLLPIEVLRHEPTLALDGGMDGLDFHRRILSRANQYLYPKGSIALEHGEDQGQALVALACQHGLVEVEDLADLTGRARILLAKTEGLKERRG